MWTVVLSLYCLVLFPSLSLSLSLSSLLFTEACFAALVIQVAFCPKFHQFLYFGLRFLSGHQFLLLVEANSRSWQWEEQSSPSLDFRPQHESHLECQNPAWNAGSGWNSPELRTRQNRGGPFAQVQAPEWNRIQNLVMMCIINITSWDYSIWMISII